MITLRELSNEMGEDRSRLRRWVIQFLGKKIIQLCRDPNGSGQMVMVVSEADAEKIRLARRAWKGAGFTESVEQSRCGHFYAIQIAPDLSLKRFKFGFAGNLEKRCSDHRTLCPTLVLVESWPATQQIEHAALSVVAKSCKHVGGEVFDVENWFSVKQKLDVLFDLLN